jgi:hypothetical protein
VVLIDREIGGCRLRKRDSATEELREHGIDVGGITEDDGAVGERDPHRRRFRSSARLFDILGTTGEQVGPQSRVLGTDYLPRPGVDQRVATIPDDATLGHAGLDNLLAEKRLDGKPPQGGHRANGLAHRPSHRTARWTDRTPVTPRGHPGSTRRPALGGSSC